MMLLSSSFLFLCSLCEEILTVVGQAVTVRPPPVFSSLHLFTQQTQAVISLCHSLWKLPGAAHVMCKNILKPIYFQAGGRAKLFALSSGCSRLVNFLWIWFLFLFFLISELFAVSEGAVRKFSDLSESLLQLHQAYVSLLTSMFSFLSSSTLDYVCEKLRSTIFQCGFTPLANDIISSFFGNESLFTSFIHPLLSNQRYSSKFIAVRKLLRSILTAASPSHVEKLFVFTEKTILRKQIQAALAKSLLKDKLFDFSEAHSCFERFYESYNASQRLVSKEVIGSNERLLCAVDRVLMRETSSFDTSQSLLFSKILCYCLFSLLVSSPTYLDTHGDYYATNCLR
jgi:hypothetical protein